MKLDEAKIKYLDTESCRLVELLEELELKKTASPKETGSLSHKKVIDLDLKLTSYTVRNGSFNIVAPIAFCENGKCVGFNEENYAQYEKFLSAINKDTNVNSVVSKEFIEDRTFKWIIDTHREQKAKSNFSSYLISEIEESAQELTIYYFIQHLDIKDPFQIGKVNFGFFTKEFFDKYVEGYRINMPNAKENPYEGMKESYQGFVYVSCVVKAEREKAKEIALRECSLAVDILKICSKSCITNSSHIKLSILLLLFSFL